MKVMMVGLGIVITAMMSVPANARVSCHDMYTIEAERRKCMRLNADGYSRRDTNTNPRAGKPRAKTPKKQQGTQ